VPRPPIRWFPAHPDNFTPGLQTGVTWEAICIHTTAGGRKVADLGQWFSLPPSHPEKRGMVGSTHFGVDEDGNIGQFVSLINRAVANGTRAGFFDTSAKLIADNRALGVHDSNTWCVGIEHLDAGEPGRITEAQFQASVHLAAWLFQEHLLPGGASGVAVDRDHILLHRQFDGRDRPFCPSWPEERVQRYIAAVRERLAEAPLAPPPEKRRTRGSSRARYIEELRGRLAFARSLSLQAALNEQDAIAKLRAEGIQDP
jgi:hypothetical protein